MENPDNLLNLLFDKTTQPIWIYNITSLEIVKVNPAALALYGYTLAEFKQKKTMLHEDGKLENVPQQDNYGSIFWIEITTHQIALNDSTYQVITAQKLEQAHVRKHKNSTKSQTDLRVLLDNSIDVICSFDSIGRFLMCSKAAINVLGYPAEKLIGTLYLDYIVPEDRLRTSDLFVKIQSGIATNNFQNSYLKPDGSTIPIVWSAKWDEAEATMFCIARDATEKLTAEKQLKEYACQITTILESITDGCFTLDIQWNITYWNQEAERLLCMPREQILGKNLWEVYRSAMSLKFYSEYHRATRETVPVHFEEFFAPLAMWIEVSAYPSSEGLSVYFKDITERKNTQDFIEKTNERFEIISKATNDILWDWDLISDKVEWNSAVTTKLGYLDDDSLNGEWWLANIHPSETGTVHTEILKAIDTADTWCQEYRFRCADGIYKNILDRGYILRDQNKKAIRMIGSMQDITVLKESERHILERNKTLTEIAFINSHEVRKPLANILGLSEMLEHADSGSMHELLQMLKTSSMELDEILKSIAKKAYILDER